MVPLVGPVDLVVQVVGLQVGLEVILEPVVVRNQLQVLLVLVEILDLAIQVEMAAM